MVRRNSWEMNLKKQVSQEKFGNLYVDTHDPNCSYSLRFDTYGKGCYYNCKYCYSRALQASRMGWYPNNPAVADIKEIFKIVKNKCQPDTVVRLGGMTDCFQPSERFKRVSYNLIRMLNKKRVHYLIVTRSPLVIEPDYLKVFDKELAHFQISIPTTDNDFIKRVSNAPSFEKGKEVVETLYSKGFDAGIRCSPFLYQTMDFDKFNNIEVEKCLVEFMRVTSIINKNFKKYMDLSDYTYGRGDFSYRHLPLDKKLEQIRKLDFKQLNICEEMPVHEAYFRKHVNCNPGMCCNLDLPKRVAKKYEVDLDNFKYLENESGN